MTMVTMAKIKCFNCNDSFLLDVQNALKQNEIKCPYCSTKVDESSLDKIFRAIGEMQDTNADLVKYHMERQEPLFQIEIESKEVKKHDTNN